MTCLKSVFSAYVRSPIARSVCKHISRRASTTSNLRVLGIESSCDDTGVAIVDGTGQILANAFHSQTSKSVELGGVVTPYAQMLHEACIGGLIQDALKEADTEVKDLDGIAVSVEPGLTPCLLVGLERAKQLVREHRVPLIPIHHMEAHALTARMIHNIDFPFLVFLLSGGHCLLAVAKDVDDFLLLGTSLDKAPGACYDRLARNMKLKNLARFSGVSGGSMVEQMAASGDPGAIPRVNVMLGDKSCNFSLTGILEYYKNYVKDAETEKGIKGSSVLSNAGDICAAFQHSVLKHLTKPLQRAFHYTQYAQIIPEHNQTLVVSGGVACNSFLRAGIQEVCDAYNYRLICPPPHLCTDNGIMVAWNGVEKLRQGKGIAENPEAVDVKGKSPLGRNVSKEITSLGLKVPNLKILKDTG